MKHNRSARIKSKCTVISFAKKSSRICFDKFTVLSIIKMSKLGFHIHKSKSTFLQFTTNQCLLKNVAKKDINLTPEISHQKEKICLYASKT